MNKEVNDYLKLSKLFAVNGYKLFLVGGVVRDVCLKHDFKDLDMVSDATPEQINAFLPDVDMTYAKYGSIKYRIDNRSYDIVTLRKEKGYSDYRHPKSITFIKDLKQDSIRRDFTINAMYMDDKFNIFDFHHGKRDLSKQIINMVGKPSKRIIEDPLRILRAIRFSLLFNFRIDKRLDKAMQKYSYLLGRINIEKINAELNKITDIKSEHVRTLFNRYNLGIYLDNYFILPDKTPLISIITPLFNAERFIAETAKSVLAQTYKNFEWIIVDDCSKDDSVNILNSLNDKRIKLIKLEKNGGTANARNIALDIAKGRYVTFLDSDDILNKDYLRNQLNFIKTNGFIVSAGYYRQAVNSNTPFNVPKYVDYHMILKGNPLSCLTTMYDYYIFKDIRFPNNTKRHEDLVFWSDILKRGAVAKGNPEILASYRIYEGSRNKTKKKLIMPLYEVFRTNYHFGIIRSLYHVLCFIRYSLKKYRNVN